MTSKGKKLRLRDYLTSYARSADLAPGTHSHYRYSVQSLEEHAGRLVTVSELSADLVNEWIEARLSAGFSRATIRGQACAVQTIWRAAHENRLTKAEPKGIRRVKVPRPIPQAWRREDLEKLLEAAATIEGHPRLTQARWSDIFRAWILVGYYSGLRGCDLHMLPMDALLSGRPIVVRQAKTDWPVTVTLPPEAIAAVRATVPPMREKFLPFPRATLYWELRKLIKKAGLRGSPKWLRRTGATAVEAAQPGASMAFLGHMTPGLALKHYVDQTIAGAKRPAPPRLALTSEPCDEYLQEHFEVDDNPAPIVIEPAKAYRVNMEEVRAKILNRLAKAERLTAQDVRDVLEALAIPQRQFARDLRCDPAYLNQILKGHRPLFPTMERRIRLALGIPREAQAVKGGAA